MCFSVMIQNLLSWCKMLLKKFIKLVVLCILVIGNIARKQELKLKQVNIIFRHGDREPISTLSGKLTDVGKQRIFEFGKLLRKQYGNFLGNNMESAIYARSTEYYRAQQSLSCLLDGLLTESNQKIWNENLKTNSIIKHYVPEVQDYLLFPTSCPSFESEVKSVESSPEFLQRVSPFEEIMKKLTKLSGKDVNSIIDMWTLYHNFLAMKARKEPIPEWAENFMPQLLNATNLTYDLYQFNDWMKKMNGGNLIRQMIKNMMNKVNENHEHEIEKMFLYSGHELNVVAMLKTLNIWKPHIPEYTSAVIIELLEDSGKYFVKVLYHLGIPQEIKEMQLPGCKTLCPLEKFIDLMSDNTFSSDEEITCDEKNEIR